MVARMAAGSGAGARHAGAREWMADEACGCGSGNRTVWDRGGGMVVPSLQYCLKD
jgi:hypothetical protein